MVRIVCHLRLENPNLKRTDKLFKPLMRVDHFLPLPPNQKSTEDGLVSNYFDVTWSLLARSPPSNDCHLWCFDPIMCSFHRSQLPEERQCWICWQSRPSLKLDILNYSWNDTLYLFGSCDSIWTVFHFSAVITINGYCYGYNIWFIRSIFTVMLSISFD